MTAGYVQTMLSPLCPHSRLCRSRWVSYFSVEETILICLWAGHYFFSVFASLKTISFPYVVMFQFSQGGGWFLVWNHLAVNKSQISSGSVPAAELAITACYTATSWLQCAFILSQQLVLFGISLHKCCLIHMSGWHVWAMAIPAGSGRDWDSIGKPFF